MYAVMMTGAGKVMHVTVQQGESDQPEEQADRWGVVPRPILEVMHILNKKIEKDDAHLRTIVWPTRPRDVQDLLRLAVSDAHKITTAGGDLRSLLTAYAHRFHEPRPVMAELARAQESSRQGIAARYSSATVDGINELLSAEPNTGVILHAFRSLSLADLTTLSGPVGDIAKRQRSGDAPFVSFAEQRRQADNRRRLDEEQRFDDLAKKLKRTPRAE